MATFRVMVFLLLMGLIGWCIFRDIQREKQFTADLQNRVIGARLQKAGISPYFYKWKQHDGPRYYDPDSFTSLTVSRTTASPFFHTLLSTISDLPQRSISRIWLIVEYLMYLICVIVAYRLSANTLQRWLVPIVAAIFLLTDAWIMHVAAGQMYIIIPMLALLFYYFFNKTSVRSAAIAGLCAVLLVLIRPTTFIFLLPFSILLIKWPMRYRLAFFVPVVVLMGWTVLNKQQRNYWLDYKKQVAEYLKVHQKLPHAKYVDDPDPHYITWEGWDRRTIEAERKKIHIPYFFEMGNFFIVYNNIMPQKMPLPVLYALTIGSLIIVTALFFRIYKKKEQLPPPVIQIALLGSCLYMLAEFFSPVNRNLYGAVQWLFPLLLSAAAFNPRLKWPAVFIVVGLILGMVHLQSVKMEHTIGEYIILLTFLWLTFTGVYRDKPPMPSPAHP